MSPGRSRPGRHLPDQGQFIDRAEKRRDALVFFGPVEADDDSIADIPSGAVTARCKPLCGSAFGLPSASSSSSGTARPTKLLKLPKYPDVFRNRRGLRSGGEVAEPSLPPLPGAVGADVFLRRWANLAASNGVNVPAGPLRGCCWSGSVAVVGSWSHCTPCRLILCGARALAFPLSPVGASSSSRADRLTTTWLRSSWGCKTACDGPLTEPRSPEPRLPKPAKECVDLSEPDDGAFRRFDVFLPDAVGAGTGAGGCRGSGCGGSAATISVVFADATLGARTGVAPPVLAPRSSANGDPFPASCLLPPPPLPAGLSEGALCDKARTPPPPVPPELRLRLLLIRNSLAARWARASSSARVLDVERPRTLSLPLFDSGSSSNSTGDGGTDVSVFLRGVVAVRGDGTPEREMPDGAAGIVLDADNGVGAAEDGLVGAFDGALVLGSLTHSSSSWPGGAGGGAGSPMGAVESAAGGTPGTFARWARTESSGGTLGGRAGCCSPFGRPRSASSS